MSTKVNLRKADFKVNFIVYDKRDRMIVNRVRLFYCRGKRVVRAGARVLPIILDLETYKLIKS